MTPLISRQSRRGVVSVPVARSRYSSRRRATTLSALLAGIVALAAGCGNGTPAHSATVDSPSSNAGSTCGGAGCSSPASQPSPPGSPEGPAVTVTSSDGYRYKISAGAPKLITQFSDPDASGSVPVPANGLYYIAIPVTVTNLQTDRATPNLGGSDSGGAEISLAVAVPTSVETAFGLRTDGPVGLATSASGCINQTGDPVLPTTVCELATTGSSISSGGIYAVDANGQDLVQDQITLPPGGSDSFILYVTPALGARTDANGVTVSGNGYPSGAPLSDLQLYYQQGYDAQTSNTRIPLG